MQMGQYQYRRSTDGAPPDGSLFGVIRSASSGGQRRTQVDFSISVGERAGVRADQQRLEFLRQHLLLLGRRLAPVASHRKRRHSREIEIRCDLARCG